MISTKWFLRQLVVELEVNLSEESRTANVLIILGLILGLLLGSLILTIVNEAFSGEAAMMIATVVIAIFTVVLAGLQWLSWQHNKFVSRANYLVIMHDKRMHVYNAAVEFLKIFMRDGEPNLEDAMALKGKIRNADFLFPEEALGFFEEMVSKSIEHKNAYDRWEPLRARAFDGEVLTAEEQEQKEQALADKMEIERWFLEQITNNRVRTELGPYLKMPASV